LKISARDAADASNMLLLKARLYRRKIHEILRVSQQFFRFLCLVASRQRTAACAPVAWDFVRVLIAPPVVAAATTGCDLPVMSGSSEFDGERIRFVSKSDCVEAVACVPAAGRPDLERYRLVVQHCLPSIRRVASLCRQDFRLDVCPVDQGGDHVSAFYMDGPPGPLLLPTIYCRFLARPYSDLHRARCPYLAPLSFSDHLLDWEARQPQLFWRGSTTGTCEGTPLADNLRVQICQSLRGSPRCDVRISRVVQYADPACHEQELRRCGIFAEEVLPQEFENYKFFPDLPGNAMAWGTLARHLHGALVFRPERYQGRWSSSGLLWHQLMRPWMHYVPVRADFADLERQLHWALDHPMDAAWIAWQGSLVAKSYLCSIDALMDSLFLRFLRADGVS